MQEIDAEHLWARHRPEGGWPWERGLREARVRQYLRAAPAEACYARLLHPLFEDLTVGDWALVWEESEDPVCGRGRTDVAFPARGLKWHDLAEDLGFDYVPGLALSDFVPHLPARRWPRALVGPEDGSLDMERMRHVIHSIDPRDADQDWYFAWCAERCFGAQSRVYRGPLAELSELFDGEHTLGSPTLWAAASERHVLITPPDRPWTLLTGPSEWIARLEGHKPLDVERLGPEARLGA